MERRRRSLQEERCEQGGGLEGVKVAEEDGCRAGRVVEDDDKVADKESRPPPPFQAEKTRCAACHVIVSTTHDAHVQLLSLFSLAAASTHYSTTGCFAV